MLRPADGVTNRRGLVGAGRFHERIGDFVKHLWRDPADALHHVRRVTREVPTQMLEDTSSVLQRKIALRKTQVVALVEPRLVVIRSLFGIESREQPGCSFFGVAKVVAQKARGIREAYDIVMEEEIVLDDV